MDCVRRYRDDVRRIVESVEWALEHDPETALRILAGPGLHWHTIEGPWVALAQEALEITSDRNAARARVLIAAALLPLIARGEDLDLVPVGSLYLGYSMTSVGNWEEASTVGVSIDAADAVIEAGEIYAELGDSHGRAYAEGVMGLVRAIGGDLEEADRVLGAVLDEHEQRLEPWACAEIAGWLAEVRLAQGDTASAQRLAHSSLSVRRDRKLIFGCLLAFDTLCRIACSEGDAKGAVEWLRETLRMQLESGAPPEVVARIHRSIGYRELCLSDLDAADLEFGEVLTLARKHGLHRVLALARLGQANIAIRRDDLERAQGYLEEANRSFVAFNHLSGRAEVLALHGYIFYAQGDRHEASRLWRRALAELREDPETIALAIALTFLAVDAAYEKNHERAATLRGAAETRLALVQIPAALDWITNSLSEDDRRLLGDETNAAAREQGRGFTGTQAIDYAIA